MTEQSTGFDDIIEHLSDPLKVKKASFIGLCSGILFITWALLLPALVWMVYGAAF